MHCFLWYWCRHVENALNPYKKRRHHYNILGVSPICPCCVSLQDLEGVCLNVWTASGLMCLSGALCRSRPFFIFCLRTFAHFLIICSFSSWRFLSVFMCRFCSSASLCSFPQIFSRSLTANTATQNIQGLQVCWRTPLTFVQQTNTHAQSTHSLTFTTSLPISVVALPSVDGRSGRSPSSNFFAFLGLLGLWGPAKPEGEALGRDGRHHGTPTGTQQRRWLRILAEQKHVVVLACVSVEWAL